MRLKEPAITPKCSPMSLTVITNESYFDPDTLAPDERHLGTRDRFDVSKQYDYPGKAVGCLEAAKMLQQRTLPGALSKIFGPIINGKGQVVAPIGWISSNRIPDFKDLERGHDSQYLNNLNECVVRAKVRCKAGEDPFVGDFGKEADVTPGTLDAAMLAVGAAYDMMDHLLYSPNGDTAFGLVWPPGHHAERNLAMGFCYLSNAALAALYARDHIVQLRPGFANRVVVIDIDHHRGNGTADVLAHQPDTLLIDISYRSPYDEIRQRFTDGQYDTVQDRYLNSGNEYPYSRRDKDWGFDARPMKKGPNIKSIEFEGEQMPHAIMERFLKEALPVLRSFKPDLILWSVGLDSAMGDPLGGLGNLPSSFYTMIRGLRLAFPDAMHGGLLEGGYDELRWFTCLPPALMALHDQPQDAINRSKAFSRYRRSFTSMS